MTTSLKDVEKVYVAKSKPVMMRSTLIELLLICIFAALICLCRQADMLRHTLEIQLSQDYDDGDPMLGTVSGLANKD